MADSLVKWEGLDDNKVPYIHWAVAVLVVFLVVAVCCWGWAPGLRSYLGGSEGMSAMGIGSSGAKQLGEWPVAAGSTALGSLSPTSANQRYVDQSQIGFESSVSNRANIPGVVAVDGMMPYAPIVPSSGFLGGPQSPLFSGPPSAPGLQGHAYLKAVNAAQQAERAGLGESGAQAAIAAESMHGGYEGAAGGENPLVLSSVGSTGFSDQELSALL